ncbi:hypothetical protein CDL15_Pgr021263 [Punica granatum]|uniref:Pentatricopeptide repeat-containing protein n=1 Tax=Punica granatum TaxID=22663 RepID=A0A218WSG4_PUNGR|nr:hypothetical protein CDL15_Pgr021263 [Punica granatum]
MQLAVSDFADLVQEMKEGHGTVVKLCDLLFRVYADNKMFDEAVVVYDFMESRRFEIDESCLTS